MKFRFEHYPQFRTLNPNYNECPQAACFVQLVKHWLAGYVSA